MDKAKRDWMIGAYSQAMQAARYYEIRFERSGDPLHREDHLGAAASGSKLLGRALRKGIAPATLAAAARVGIRAAEVELGVIRQACPFWDGPEPESEPCGRCARCQEADEDWGATD